MYSAWDKGRNVIPNELTAYLVSSTEGFGHLMFGEILTKVHYRVEQVSFALWIVTLSTRLMAEHVSGISCAVVPHVLMTTLLATFEVSISVEFG